MFVFVRRVQVKVREEHQALIEVIKRNTELLQTSSRLMEETSQVDGKRTTRQTEAVMSSFSDKTELN